MRKTFLVASTGDRTAGLMELLQSLKPHFDKGWTACVVGQCYDLKDEAEIRRVLGDNGVFFHFDKLIGAHSAKVYGLEHYDSDIWCSLDDDMVATDRTDYENASRLLIDNPFIGFISCNWARTQELASKKPIEQKLIKQKLTFTGGGMLFRDDVAEIIRHIPNEQYEFDDCLWAMYAYIEGYVNYRFKGSVTVHKICSKGGRRTWIKLHEDRVLPPADLLRVRRGKDESGYNKYLICVDSDLTNKAHRLHFENKKW